MGGEEEASKDKMPFRIDYICWAHVYDSKWSKITGD